MTNLSWLLPPADETFTATVRTPALPWPSRRLRYGGDWVDLIFIVQVVTYFVLGQGSGQLCGDCPYRNPQFL